MPDTRDARTGRIRSQHVPGLNPANLCKERFLRPCRKLDEPQPEERRIDSPWNARALNQGVERRRDRNPLRHRRVEEWMCSDRVAGCKQRPTLGVHDQDSERSAELREKSLAFLEVSVEQLPRIEAMVLRVFC